MIFELPWPALTCPADVCRTLGRFGIPFDKLRAGPSTPLRTGFGDQLEAQKYPSVTALVHLDSEGCP